MEKMNDLKDLLKHEIYDLRSAEQQIVKALPAMIAKANNAQLKTALENHLQITYKQLTRLEQVLALFDEAAENGTAEKKGLLARLFKRNHVCRGMKGLIEEGEKIMAEEMNAEVLDAAIIASAQKIEHYEICGYGTAKAFAAELNLPEAVRLLNETLQEEYETDILLTEMAVERLNKKAEVASKKISEPSVTNATQPKNLAFEALDAIQERPIAKEMEPELVTNPTKNATGKKQNRAKNQLPQGEAERSEAKREPVSVKRTSTNNSNSKKAKPGPPRKSSGERSSRAGRSR